MKLVFCFEGRTFKGPLAEMVQDYTRRLSRMLPCEIIEAKHLKYQQRDGVHILLTPEGRRMNSTEFAAVLEEYLTRGNRHIFFYIGGPEGFEPAIKERADLSLSLSPMTMNHQLIRVVLLEQVYRAMTIIRHEPYHK